MNLEARKAIIFEWFPEAVAGHIKGEPVFFVRCPGDGKHENREGPKHTAVYYTGETISINCVHRSCREEVLDLQYLMRRELRDLHLPDEDSRAVMNRPSVERQRQLAFARATAGKILVNREKIYAKYWDESFLKKRLSLGESRDRYFALYQPTDIIWIGRENDSGPFRGDGHFRTVEDWAFRTDQGDLYPFTSTSTYQAGSASRCAACVVEHLRLVLEFDELDPDPVRNRLCGWALFQYLRATYNLQLHLCVDTGNKSPHFWVGNVPRLSEMFLLILQRIGADPRCLRPSQPVRFPGVMRSDGKVINQPQCVVAV